jgi:hypothetical protein
MGDVIDFFSRKKIIQNSNKKTSKKESKSFASLEKVMKKNALNKERLKKDRNQANKSVVKNCKVKQPV